MKIEGLEGRSRQNRYNPEEGVSPGGRSTHAYPTNPAAGVMATKPQMAPVQ